MGLVLFCWGGDGRGWIKCEMELACLVVDLGVCVCVLGIIAWMELALGEEDAGVWIMGGWRGGACGTFGVCFRIDLHGGKGAGGGFW